MIYLQGKPKYSEKTCPVQLCATNPTWIDPGANPGLRGERPATNRLSRGTALVIFLSYINKSSADKGVEYNQVNDSATNTIITVIRFILGKFMRYLSCIRPARTVGEPGSSVSIVSGYGLDDRAIEVRSPAEAK
jgi:hypothetical protein